jgi:hypothetical protein
VIAFILFFVLGYFYNAKTATPQSITTSTSDTLYLMDTTKHISIHNHFYSSSIYTVVPISKIDTNAIIKNYFTKRFVADTLRDSLLYLVIADTLYNNNLIYRKRQYELLKPYQKQITTTNSITVTVSQKGFYAGAFFGFNSNALQSAGVEANYITHKINYGLGYDFKNNAITGKLLFNLSKK